MMLTKDQLAQINNLAATWFEKSDDLIAVSTSIEEVIERRLEFRKRQDEREKRNDGRA